MTHLPERPSVAAFLLSASLLGVAFLSGCYKPNIKDGGLGCSEAGTCPEGFSCVSGHCHKAGGGDAAAVPDAKPDMSMDMRGPDLVLMSDASDASDVCVSRTAQMGCSVQSGLTCDPVCQTRCCTTQKCSALNVGPGPMFGCVSNKPVRGLLDPCTPSNTGTAQRSDDCSPGLVCVDGVHGAFCLKLCRGDADCGFAKCEQRPIEAPAGSPVASVCAIDKTVCDPINTAMNGCPPGRVCYLTDTDPAGDTTVCEITSGDARRNDACVLSRECLPGLTCANKGAGVNRCLQVCSRAAVPDACATSSTVCQANGKDYDYCY